MLDAMDKTKNHETQTVKLKSSQSSSVVLNKGGDFCPQGTSDNSWKHFGLHTWVWEVDIRGVRCCWY